MTIIVTGGAEFIGSNFIYAEHIVCVDRLAAAEMS